MTYFFDYATLYKQNTVKCVSSPPPPKSDLGITKNYRGITLTVIVATVYIAQLRNRIRPEVEKIWEEKSDRLLEKSIDNVIDSGYQLNHQTNTSKKSRDNTIVRRFLQGI